MSSADEMDLTPPKLTPSEGATSLANASAIEGSESVDASDRVDGSDPVHASDRVDSVMASHAIAEGLATGALDPVAAQQLLIDQVLAEQLPAGVAPEQLERIRGELATLLAGDPTLAALLQP